MYIVINKANKINGLLTDVLFDDNDTEIVVLAIHMWLNRRSSFRGWLNWKRINLQTILRDKIIGMF